MLFFKLQTHPHFLNMLHMYIKLLIAFMLAIYVPFKCRYHEFQL